MYLELTVVRLNLFPFGFIDKSYPEADISPVPDTAGIEDLPTHEAGTFTIRNFPTYETDTFATGDFPIHETDTSATGDSPPPEANTSRPHRKRGTSRHLPQPASATASMKKNFYNFFRFRLTNPEMPLTLQHKVLFK